MTVSVVVASFNRGHFLDEAVGSVMAQTYASVETIIVDDGSTDPRTLAALDHWTQRGVTVIRQENQGPAAARNNGIRAASGAYILCLDDDDRIDPAYAGLAVELFEGDPSLGVVSAGARLFGSVDHPWRLDPFSPERLALGNCVHAASFFRRDDWARVGGYDEELRYYEDYDLWVKICSLGRRFERLPQELFRYRVGHTSLLRPGEDRDVREAKASAYARVVANNRSFFCEHFEVVNDRRRECEAELHEWREVYGPLDRRAGGMVRAVIPWLKRVKRRLA